MALKMCFLSFRLNYIDGLWTLKGCSGESKPLFHGTSLEAEPATKELPHTLSNDD